MALSSRAEALIRRSVVWDNHGCMPLRVDDRFLPELERYRSTGHTVVSLNIGYDALPWHGAIRVAAHFRDWIRRHPDQLIQVRTVADVEEARRSGRLGICFDLEGTVALDDQISMVGLYYDLGVRWMLMAYNQRNSVGGGCLDGGGLTAFGRRVLDEMTRVGMVPCCSHTSWETARDVLDHVAGPVIFSHSNAHAVHAHPRNIPDDLARGCAASGGVIGVVGYGPFIGRTAGGQPDSGTDALFRHIDHFVSLVGPDHVGLGLDYVFDVQEAIDYYKAFPERLPAAAGYSADDQIAMVEPERIGAIVQVMLDHGYDDATIGKILGGNHLRVAATCWR